MIEVAVTIICMEALGLATDTCIATLRYCFKQFLIQYLSESATNEIHTLLDVRVFGKGFEEESILIL